MLTITLPAATVLLYDSIKDIPASIYQYAKQYEIMSAELGQNESEQDTMLAKAQDYIKAGRPDDALDQIANYRTARSLTLSRFQAGQIEWACHVHSVNGVVVTDYSEKNLIRLIDKWSGFGVTQRLIEETLADVKKNSVLS